MARRKSDFTLVLVCGVPRNIAEIGLKSMVRHNADVVENLRCAEGVAPYIL